ncbi:TPA: hypothetical protein OCX73_003501 [Escherichia coli]|nr:hypothetical protein [Escherichia coli]HCP1404255.1 hypothetical protein [Escherichia coli]HCP1523611.1 hypothetical protein [Escherichia coli]HCP1559605.1 hypothetical protein [Escherichia coli]HCP1651531.1 hypothetical protein [Escherichia coli]
MNTRILFPLLFTVASFSASAGNWAVKNGWCQTMTGDGQALVMLKNGTIGITGLMQGCRMAYRRSWAAVSVLTVT